MGRVRDKSRIRARDKGRVRDREKDWDEVLIRLANLKTCSFTLSLPLCG